jgi:hypothetical protein
VDPHHAQSPTFSYYRVNGLADKIKTTFLYSNDNEDWVSRQSCLKVKETKTMNNYVIAPDAEAENGNLILSIYHLDGVVERHVCATMLAPNMFKVEAKCAQLVDAQDIKDIAKFSLLVNIEGIDYVGHKAPRALMALWKELATVHGGKKLMSLLGNLIVTKTKESWEATVSYVKNLPNELKALWKKIVEVLTNMVKEDWVELLLAVAYSAAVIALTVMFPAAVAGIVVGYATVRCIENIVSVFKNVEVKEAEVKA